MKVAIFSSSEIGEESIMIEDAINDWIADEGLCAADIMKIAQSESVDTETNCANITISVWYSKPTKRGQKSTIPTLDEVINPEQNTLLLAS